MRNKGRYRGPGYKQVFSHWRMKNGKYKEHKFYWLMADVTVKEPKL